MKIVLLLPSILLLLLPQSTAAQTPTAIDGLQVIAERQYAAEGSDPVGSSADGLVMIVARVYLFEDADTADSTWSTLVEAESIENDLPEDDDSFTYEKEELEDVGDRAQILNLTAEISESETGVFRTILIQEGEMIVTVTAIAGSPEAAESADTIAQKMIEREPSDEDSNYDGLGGSTGGVWDVFLPADADELGDIVAIADKETRPAA